MAEECPLGLREQKRRATRRALQVAMLERALEHGSENVTIEEVCRAAQVSPRTFFNYFASKEDALAAPAGPLAIPDGDIEEFVRGESDVLTDLVHLTARNIDDRDDLEVHRLRKALLEREPHLLGVRIAEARRFHELAARLTARRLEADAEREGAAFDETTISRRADLIVLLVAAVARHGWSLWVAADGSVDLEHSLLAAFAEFREVCAPVAGSSGPLVGG